MVCGGELSTSVCIMPILSFLLPLQYDSYPSSKWLPLLLCILFPQVWHLPAAWGTRIGHGPQTHGDAVIGHIPEMLDYHLKPSKGETKLTLSLCKPPIHPVVLIQFPMLYQPQTYKLTISISLSFHLSTCAVQDYSLHTSRILLIPSY